MKNDHLPLIQALKARSKKKSEPDVSIPPFESLRTFDVQHSEIPGLPGRRIGEPITVNLHGHIHSQHSDGRAVIKVASVKPDTKEMDAKENPDTKETKEMRIGTQQSHA